MLAALDWNPEVALDRIREFVGVSGALIPILHCLQEEFGYVDEAAVPMIARELNISQAEVHGVISFYHDFRREPAGRHILQICRAEACQAMGCESLVQHVERRLDIKIGATASNQSITLKPVYCLGNCALSPAVMLDGKPYGRMTPSAVDVLIEKAQRDND
jgi:formate dehydrogenase subunit gamma